MAGEETLSLKWNQFGENLQHSLTDLKEKNYFSDVTLACEDKEIRAHKLILSACSPFFRRLLLKKSYQEAKLHPIIYLRGVQAEQLEAVVAFIYHGEVNILEERLDNFMLVAKDLQLKGLTALYEKEPNLFHQDSSKQHVETKEKETNKDKDGTKRSSNKKDAINKKTEKVEEEQRAEINTDLVKIETDLVNEDTEKLPMEENEDALKGFAGNKDCLKEKDAGKDENEHLEIDLDVINPKVDLDDGADVNGFVLHEENIKEILDTSCLNLKGQERKEDAIDSEIVKQKIDAELDIQKETKQTKNFSVNQEALKETMLKTWSKKGEEKKDSNEKEAAAADVDVDGQMMRGEINVKNLIHKDVIQSTSYKDKREALMERHLRNKTSGSKRQWSCKVCGYKSKHIDHVRCHVETHIEGLEYVCDLCGNITKTSAAFGVHQYRCSTKLSLSNPEVAVRRYWNSKHDPYWSQQ